MPTNRFIRVHPGVRFGKPCLGGTRLTGEEVARWWWATDMTLAEMARGWPDLDREAIIICCWYQARFGTAAWRKRWRDWLIDADVSLWKGKPAAEIALPPRKGEN